MSNEIALMREITKLQEQINALRTIEVGGVWTAWTPAVTAPSGTPPTYSTATGLYTAINDLVIASVILQNTTGGTAGSGAVILLISLPIANNTSPVFQTLGYGSYYNADIPEVGSLIARYNTSTTLYLHKGNGNNLVASEQANANRYIFLNLVYGL